MIKVLRPGNTTKEIECKRCNALLSYCRNDIKSLDTFYVDKIVEEEYIPCPECGAKIIISSREINNHDEILSKLESRKSFKLNRRFF